MTKQQQHWRKLRQSQRFDSKNKNIKMEAIYKGINLAFRYRKSLITYGRDKILFIYLLVYSLHLGLLKIPAFRKTKLEGGQLPQTLSLP